MSLSHRHGLARLGVLVFASAISLHGSQAHAEDDAVGLCFCSGRAKGNYNSLANRISKHPSLQAFQIEVVTTEGSYENTGLLRDGKCEIALVQSDVAYLEHWNGRPFKAVASLYTEVVHVAARRELGFEEVRDFLYTDEELEIAIGEQGSGSASHALTILDELARLKEGQEKRWRKHYLRLTEALSKIKKRTLDVAFVTSAIPVGALPEAAKDKIVTLLEIDREIIQSLRRQSPFLVLSEIPYEVYSGRRDIATLGLRALLVIQRDAPSELVDPLLEAVYDLAEDPDFPFLADLSPVIGLDEIPIPIHPASLKYHEKYQAGLARFFEEYRSYAIPIVILLVPIFLLRSRTALFIHQYMLGRILVLLGCVWLGGASTMFLIEGQKNSAFSSFWKSAIAILHYLFSGLESKYPITTEGTVVSILILTCGVVVVALFTATVVSLLVEQTLNVQRLRSKPALFRLRHHVVIIGWSKRTERIIRQLRCKDISEKPSVVVVTRDASKAQVRNRRLFKNVWVVEGHPCDRKTLERADLEKARFALILSDEPASEQAELQAVTNTLTIEEMAPEVYSMAAVNNRLTVEHLKHCQANEVVNVQELSEKLIGQAVVSPRVMRVFDELLTFGPRSQEFYFASLPERLAGSTFGELQRELPMRYAALPVGFRKRSNGPIVLNPTRNPEAAANRRTPLDEADQLVIVADDANALETGFWRRFAKKRRQSPTRETRMPNLKDLRVESDRSEGEEIKVGICGWNPEGRDVISQLRDPVIREKYRFAFKVICPPSVSLLDKSKEEGAPEDVSFVFGDPLQREVLANAGVAEFRSLVILAERDDPRAAKYSDHRSLAVALAAKELSSDLHIVVEVLESRNREHFENIPNIEIVSVEDLAEKLMAQTVISRGITQVFERLLTATEDSNEIYLVPVPESWAGRTFRDVYLGLVESSEEVCLLGYESLTGEGTRALILNPSREQKTKDGAVDWQEYELKQDDSLIIMAYQLPDW